MSAPADPDPPPPAGAGTLFFRNRHLLVLTIVVILVAGYSALQSLPRLEDPTITHRNPRIFAFLPGATPERVEALVTEKIEKELEEIDEIKDIDSTSQTGISVIAIELEDAVTSRTNQVVFGEIRDRLGDAAASFPPGVLPPEFDDKRNAVAFTLIASLTWEKGAPAGLGILGRQAEELADRLRAVPGTELVRIYGEPDEEISVTLDDAELAALGLTVRDLSRALEKADVKVPSGRLRSAGADLLLEIQGELDSATRVREVPILRSPSGDFVRLGDIATVRRGMLEPPREIGLADGSRAVFVAARVQADQRVDLWTADARSALDGFRAEVGGGIRLDPFFVQDTYTSARLGELAGNLLLGAGVVFLVVFFTLGWRSSLIIGSALPLTAGATLFVVALTGGKLHQMSIFGMIIALGLLIDNAIVVTDEVGRRLREGSTRAEAVSGALRHLFLPLLSSTLTTILAFLPILLLPGPAGDFVGSIGKSVVIALTCSFSISMTVIAALAGCFAAARRTGSGWFGWLRNGIPAGPLGPFAAGCLRFTTGRPAAGLLAGAAIPAAGFLLATTLGSQFFPRTDRDMFEIELWMPAETPVTRTREVAERLESLVRDRDAVRSVHWLVGGSFPSVYYNLVMDKDGSSFYAHGIVRARDDQAVRAMIDDLQAEIDRRFPEAQVVVSKFAQGPPAPADVEFRLLGPETDRLQELGDQVRLSLAEHSGILHTRVTMPRGIPKLVVAASEENTRLAGLELGDLADQLRGALDGSVGGSVLEEVEEMPVRIRYRENRRDGLDDLVEARFVSSALPGSWTPLSALGRVELKPEDGAITRRNGRRTNKVLGYAAPGTLPIDIASEVRTRLEETGFQLPPGYDLQIGGESENQEEAVGNLLLYLPILIVLTIAVLILSFRSARIALILLLVAPLSAGFGLLATWVLQFPLSFNTVIGSLGLMGLAFNSSIVVLAAIRANPAANGGDVPAMVRETLGCGRHLLSTTLTTMGSFLPLLLFIGGEFWPPLAIVLAGGVGGSTLLALVFTPAAYRLLRCGRSPQRIARSAG